MQRFCMLSRRFTAHRLTRKDIGRLSILSIVFTKRDCMPVTTMESIVSIGLRISIYSRAELINAVMSMLDIGCSNRVNAATLHFRIPLEKAPTLIFDSTVLACFGVSVFPIGNGLFRILPK